MSTAAARWLQHPPTVLIGVPTPTLLSAGRQPAVSWSYRRLFWDCQYNKSGLTRRSGCLAGRGRLDRNMAAWHSLTHNGTVARYAAFLRGINLGPTNKVSMPRAAGNGRRPRLHRRGHLHQQRQPDLHQPQEGGRPDRAGVSRPSEAFRRRHRRCGPYAGAAEEDPGRQPLPRRQPEPGDGRLPDQGGACRRQEEGRRDSHRRRALTFAGSEVYVHYSNGMAGASWRRSSATIIGVSSTVRNINTVTKVLALCERALAPGRSRALNPAWRVTQRRRRAAVGHRRRRPGRRRRSAGRSRPPCRNRWWRCRARRPGRRRSRSRPGQLARSGPGPAPPAAR